MLVFPHVGEELRMLGASCVTVKLSEVNGWSVDVWDLPDESLRHLVDVYRVLLDPERDERIRATLLAEGVDMEAILLDAEHERGMITRSDMTELAAAAAAIGVDGWPLETLHMPNVPKGSRAASESGIDILAVTLDSTGPTDALLPHERLHLASVKHTVSLSGASDLMTKLIHSVSPTSLTPAYLASQLRVLHGRLQERGFANYKRTMLFMSNDPVNATNIDIVVIGAVDRRIGGHFQVQTGRLPETNLRIRHCRELIIDNLPSLEERV